jgi:hypothetical protein
MLELCAAELHQRVTTFVTDICAAHTSISGGPSTVLKRAAKEWLASRIAAELPLFAVHLWKPRAAFHERGEPDNLLDAARREQDSAFALLDLHWGKLERDAAERMQRAVVRGWRALRAVWRTR